MLCRMKRIHNKATCILVFVFLYGSAIGQVQSVPDCSVTRLESMFGPKISRRIMSQDMGKPAALIKEIVEHSAQKKAYALYCAADYSLTQGRDELALSMFVESVRYSKSLWAYWGKAQLSLEAGKCHAALDAYSAADTLHQGYVPNFYIEYGAAEVRCGDPARALNYVLKERNHSPFEQNERWLMIEGSAYLQLNNYERALEAFEEGINFLASQYGYSVEQCSSEAPCISPTLASLYERKIDALCLLGRMEEAREALDAAKGLQSVSVPSNCVEEK